MPETTKAAAPAAAKNVPILSRLSPPEGAVRNHKRKGRGVGSGLGKTAGRGQKGQTARQPGAFHKLHFEGGQMPLNRRLPKVGFENPFRKTFAVVNVADLEVFDAGATVDEAGLRHKGIVRGAWDGVKILGQGELKKKLVVKAEKFSASAKEKVEKAGGSCQVVEHPVKPVVRHKNKKKAS